MKVNTGIFSAILLFLAATIVSAEGRYESEKKTVKYDNVNQLDVSNVTGKIDITGWNQNYVEVTYLKKARDEKDLEDIGIDIDRRDDVLYIVTDMPWRCRNCAVDYEISVPEKFKSIVAETVTGSVSIDNMKFVDEIAAKSTTGSINGDFGARDIEADVVTGSIKLFIDNIPDDGRIEAETVTGSINVKVPGDFQADVDLSAVTGSVGTDFDMDRVELKKKNKLEARIGNGRIICNLSTVTGSIHLGAL
jgi:hypothetical protein